MEALLFTGASGFLGNNILPILKEKYEVTTLGHLPVDDLPVNLAKDVPVLPKHFDIVLHAAGKAHVVPKTAEEEKLFYDINFEGTKICANLWRAWGLQSLSFSLALLLFMVVKQEI